MASLQNLGCRGPVESRVSSALGSLPPMSHCRVLRSVAYDSRSIYSKVTHTFMLRYSKVLVQIPKCGPYIIV